MRCPVVVVLLLLLTGCEDRSPENRRFRVGEGAIVYLPPGEDMVFYRSPRPGGFVKGEPGFGLSALYHGDRVVVLRDETVELRPDRKVLVRIVWSKHDIPDHTGAEGLLERLNLRPTPHPSNN